MDKEMVTRWRQTLLPMNDDFLIQVGIFQGAWGVLEISVDFAICRLLKLDHHVAHAVCAQFDFNRRVRIIQEAAKRTNAPNKDQLIRSIRTIQNTAKRNIFMHCFTSGTKDTVTFLERTREGDLKFWEHTYTLPEFEAHVAAFCKMSEDFANALGASEDEFVAFIEAIPRDKKS